MARRNLLHRSKLDEFVAFLDQNEITHRPGRGDWEVLQIQMEDGRWQCIFDRIKGDHYTVPNPLIRLVERFIQ